MLPLARHKTPEGAIDIPPSEQISRPKGKPTVTPRTFRRFFTPRMALIQTKETSGHRYPLIGITDSEANRACGGNNEEVSRALLVQALNDDENPRFSSNDISGRKRSLHSPEPNPENCRWLKKPKKLTNDIAADSKHQFKPDLGFSLRPQNIDFLPPSKEVKRAEYRNKLGFVSQRELGLSSGTSRLPLADLCPDWRSELASFCTIPDDVHINRNVSAQPLGLSLPFCTAACNTNTLIAIGDDEGAIRLLESEKNGSPALSRPYLAFRPHTNAILDITFSSDDSMLATASGDQTGQVIDMQTQTMFYQMRGHASSVKQVRFQPGTGDKVLATSSRDGSVQIWDLRCSGTELSVSEDRSDLGAGESCDSAIISTRLRPINAARVNSIIEAHVNSLASIPQYGVSSKHSNMSRSSISSKLRPQSRNATSVTAISFFSSSEPYFLLTGSEASATVKLWDLRMNQSLKGRDAVPLSTTSQPHAHGRHRQFGLTSMTMNGDCSRLYTLCKDNSVYVYSTSHLILGMAPETPYSSRTAIGGGNKRGLGPLFAFRHPKLVASTFYVKTSLRLESVNHTEILAVGSTNSCAVLFPTNERYLKKQFMGSLNCYPNRVPEERTFNLHSGSSFGQSVSGHTSEAQPKQSIPIYKHGVALVNGHEKEVTSLAWNVRGDLLTVGDDMRCRVWREDSDKASSLRLQREKSGSVWNHGWTEFGGEDSGWDSDE